MIDNQKVRGYAIYENRVQLYEKGRVHMCQEKIHRNSDDIDKYSYDLSIIFKAFGDITRIKILCVLLEKEYCVNDISQKLEMTQSSVSHQLSVLKNARLIKFRKEGKMVFYSLDDNHVETILRQGLDHLAHNAVELSK